MNPNRILIDLLCSLENEFYVAEVKYEIQPNTGAYLRLPWRTAEAGMRQALLRAIQVCRPGSTLYLSWENQAHGQILHIKPHSPVPPPDLSVPFMPRHSPVHAQLNQAGIQVIGTDTRGPWAISFDDQMALPDWRTVMTAA